MCMTQASFHRRRCLQLFVTYCVRSIASFVLPALYLLPEIIYILFISTRDLKCNVTVFYCILRSENVIVMKSLYRVIQEERKVLGEVTVSVIIKKIISYLNVSACEWPHRHSCLNLHIQKHLQLVHPHCVNSHRYQNTIVYKSNTTIIYYYYYYVECQKIDNMFRPFLIAFTIVFMTNEISSLYLF